VIFGLPVWAVAAGAAAVAAASSSPAPARAGKRLVLKAILAKPSGDVVTISREQGYTPVWLQSVGPATMEWGACVWDLLDEQTQLKVREEKRGVQALVNAIGWVTEYVIGLVKAATLDVSLCFRIDLPAARWEWSGLTMYSPCQPDVRFSVPPLGLHPEAWPLGDTPPEGSPGPGWVKNLGDLFGWGQDVYHVVALYRGEWGSWPVMKRAGWRRGLVLAGETLASAQSATLSMPFGKLREYFKDHRCPDQEYKLHVPSTRKKAMNRFS